MDRKYRYYNNVLSTTHFIFLTVVYFSSKYESMIFKNGKAYLPAAVLFLFGNYYVFSMYNSYFLRKSFEKKYRDVDDENLENIIKSLESYRVKAH